MVYTEVLLVPYIYLYTVRFSSIVKVFKYKMSFPINLHLSKANILSVCSACLINVGFEYKDIPVKIPF